MDNWFGPTTLSRPSSGKTLDFDFLSSHQQPSGWLQEHPSHLRQAFHCSLKFNNFWDNLSIGHLLHWFADCIGSFSWCFHQVSLVSSNTMGNIWFLFSIWGNQVRPIISSATYGITCRGIPGHRSFVKDWFGLNKRVTRRSPRTCHLQQKVQGSGEQRSTIPWWIWVWLQLFSIIGHFSRLLKAAIESYLVQGSSVEFFPIGIND